MRVLSRIGHLLERVWAFLVVLDEHDVTSAASAMAFHAFFSLVPLFALSGWAVQHVVKADVAAFAPLFRFTPTAVNLVADAELMRLSESSHVVLPPLSIAGFLWLCSGGLSQSMHQFEKVFGHPTRSWLRRRAIALGWVLIALAVTAGGVMLGVYVDRFGDLGTFVARWLIPFLGLWLLLGFFFRHATLRDRNGTRRGFVGALLTLGFWTVLSAAFSIYVRDLADYSRFFGGVAAVAVLLLWLWLMSLSLLVGGELNARMERTRDAKRDETAGDDAA